MYQLMVICALFVKEHWQLLLSPENLVEIVEFIEEIKSGKEKTGLVSFSDIDDRISSKIIHDEKHKTSLVLDKIRKCL